MTKRLLLASALFFSALNYAQDKPAESTKETPSRIKVYTPSGSQTGKSSKDNSYKWDVKTDIFGIISGEIPIIGEYRIARKFSVEASAALTYAYLPNDFLGTSAGNESSIGDTKAAMGSAFRGTIKYYPSSDYDAIEGWNFGLQFYTKTTNRDYNTTGDGAELLNGNKDSKTKTGVSLIIGKQIFEDSNVTFESYLGIGFANVKREYSSLNTTYDSNNNNYSYSVSTFSTNEMKPNFQIGLKIGFGN